MLENVLDRILKNHLKRVLEKWLKIMETMFPYLKCSSMKPGGNGSRTSNIEDLDIFKATVLQIEATGNFKNLKRMKK